MDEDNDAMLAAAYLQDCKWNETDAVQRIMAYLQSVKVHGSPHISHILPYVGVDLVTNRPKPCGVLLENLKGGCARDKKGNPIVVIYGAFECDGDNAIKQMNFLMHRVRRYIASTELPFVTYVFDSAPRAGLHSMDVPVISFIRHMSNFPQSFRMIVCGAPAAMVSAWNIGKAVLPRQTVERTEFCQSYDILKEYIDTDNMLQSWGGTFSFSISDYMQHLFDSC